MTVFIIALILFLIFLFMIMPSRKYRKRLEKYNGMYITHRGLYDNENGVPENSLLAFKKAVEKGYGIEFDIRLTKDKEVVVFHDSSILRMCGADKKVYDLTLEELKEYNLLSTNEKIPTLKEFLGTVGKDTMLFVEVKTDGYAPLEIFSKAREILKDYKGEYCVQSFDPRILRCYKKNQPEIIRGQLATGDYNRGFLIGILSCLLANFISRPHYIAYRYPHRKNVFFKISKLLGGYAQGWTVQTKKELEEAKRYYKIFIFEHFEP